MSHFASDDSLFLESKQNYSGCISQMEQTCFPVANQSATSSLTQKVSLCPTKPTANGMTLQDSCPTTHTLRLCHRNSQPHARHRQRKTMTSVCPMAPPNGRGLGRVVSCAARKEKRTRGDPPTARGCRLHARSSQMWWAGAPVKNADSQGAIPNVDSVKCELSPRQFRRRWSAHHPRGSLVLQ